MAILEGLPAGVPVRREDIARELARRRQGYGRGPRMGLESDSFEILAGVRHGRTLGSPVAILIENAEWPKWREVMSPDPAAGEVTPITRPRPGHADLPGVMKYGFDDVRNVLERASARETAARVAAGALARSFLGLFGVDVVSHVVAVGGVRARVGAPGPGENPRVDASRLRCLDPEAEEAMVARVEEARRRGDTVGGVFEVIAYGLPPGLGSYVQWDRRLDARIAAAVMSIPAVKGVEVGDGFALADLPGSLAHDEILPGPEGPRRRTARAGGLEGGMTTGDPLRVRAAMKPLSSLGSPLRTVDIRTGEEAEAVRERSDVCAVPAAAVVAEAVVALVLADAFLEKFGGDSVEETGANLRAYLGSLERRFRGRPEGQIPPVTEG